jgi:hypothetical protein
VSPSVFAVLRLMAISIFVTCCTGRSAGCVPLRIQALRASKVGSTVPNALGSLDHNVILGCSIGISALGHDEDARSSLIML